MSIHDVLAASLTGPLTTDSRLVQTACPSATDEALYEACNQVQDAHHHGKQWQWQEAEAALNRAYAALGAVNPGTGADWHAGRHPIQQSRHHPLAEARGDDSKGWWAYTGYNKQAVYAWGTAAQADRYQDHLNAGRDVNHYALNPVAADEAQQLGLERRTDVVTLGGDAPEAWRFDANSGSLYQRQANGAPGGPASYVHVYRSATARNLDEALREYWEAQG